MAKKKSAKPTRKSPAKKQALARALRSASKKSSARSKLLKSPKPARKPARSAKASRLLGIGSKRRPVAAPAGKATTNTRFKKAPVKLAAPGRTQSNLAKTEPNVQDAPLPGPVPKMPAEGEFAPDFELPDDVGRTVRLSDLRGRKVIVYFYPRDDTPGCSLEAQGFRDDYAAFQDLGVEVFGISKDDVRSHQAFRTKYNLNFPLLADTTGETIRNYGCWQEKNLYGKKIMGTQRATFLIDEEGRVAKVWPKVTPEGHSQEILEVLQA